MLFAKTPRAQKHAVPSSNKKAKLLEGKQGLTATWSNIDPKTVSKHVLLDRVLMDFGPSLDAFRLQNSINIAIILGIKIW